LILTEKIYSLVPSRTKTPTATIMNIALHLISIHFEKFSLTLDSIDSSE